MQTLSTTTAKISDRWWRSSLIVIGLACFAACVAVDLTYFTNTTLSSDEDRFLHSAAELLTQGQFRIGDDRAWEMPGTAVFFAAVSYFAPASPLTAVRIANAALVALQSVLVGLLAARIFRDRLAGLLAAAMAGFYPYLIFTQGQALSETPFDFLLVAGLLTAYVWRDRGAHLNLVMAAAVAILTAATLTKATLTILPPILVAVLAIGRQPWPKVMLVFIGAAAIYAALMSPWWVRNYSLFGQFVPFSTSSSRNLYMGNSPNNPDVATYAPYLPQNWAVDHGVDLEQIPGELERYRAFRDSAVDYIRKEPRDFLRRAIIKFFMLWSIVPNAPAFQRPLYRWVGAASFAPVLLLTVVCCVSRRRQFVELLPFYIIIGYFTALYTATIASIRYRLPIEPLLIVLASYPLALILRSGVTAYRRGPYRSRDASPGSLG